MKVSDQLIIINGCDNTESVSSFQFVNGICNIVYSGSTKIYPYNSRNVKVLKLQKVINPQDVIIKENGRAIFGVNQILDFGERFYVVQNGKKGRSIRKNEIEISVNCLADRNNHKLFDYFKETAAAISLIIKKDEKNSDLKEAINVLDCQYQRITEVSENTVLAKYLKNEQPEARQSRCNELIYPFGLNQSQKKAVENAFSSQISIIQGPPGTGKTQTILNIIANAVLNRKTVAVVSNNNSATKNVAEKLHEKELSFLTAFLGSWENKTKFLEQQSGEYPDNMSKWAMGQDAKQELRKSIMVLSSELYYMLDAKNRIAEIEAELFDLKPEQFSFHKYYPGINAVSDIQSFKKLSSEKIISLWLEYENQVEHDKSISPIKKLLFFFRFSKAGLAVFKTVPTEAISFLKNLYYQKRISELQQEKSVLEYRLKNYCFEEKMKFLRKWSIKLLKADLAERYNWESKRQHFEIRDFRSNSEEFNREYPVILSTTYSIRGTLSNEYTYDYLIVDEASQVDLATSVLTFSCAKNIVIVGDQKQLSNVLKPKYIPVVDSIWKKYMFDERYHFATHSMLSSAVEIWQDAPTVLLREHYRCHPQIANFFNRKFYNGELIIMTKDCGENDVITMYRTVDGNHARGRVNQRQIDVIKEEILPTLTNRGFSDIGIITPYRDQVSAISDSFKEFPKHYEIDTVHKFQGREKEAIILTSVDNEIGEFVDDPNMFNVAVSRAVKALAVVISNNAHNKNTLYGDLEKYIKYHDFKIVDSKVRSVFDLLYKEYNAQRKEYLKKYKRESKYKESEYVSENLASAVITEILKQPQYSNIDYDLHVSLSDIVNVENNLLTEAEANYAKKPGTHVDFLLFNIMDKSPVLVIEIDGTNFHAKGSLQAERDELKNSILKKSNLSYLRIRTNESGEKERICNALDKAIRN